MADTLTANYKWVQPQVGGDAATWGTLLNADLAAIDAVVYANQQAGSAIGDIKMFGGATPPTNWLACDGRSLSTATYAALFAVIGYAHGGSGANFNLPNLQAAFPLGAGPSNAVGGKGGTYSYTLSVANLPAHAHGVSDPHHTHGVTQTAHAHAVGDPGHTHTITDVQHEHLMGGGYGGGIGGVAPPHPLNDGTTNTYTGPSYSGINITNSAVTGVTVQPQNANVTISSAATGVTTTNTGAGTPISIIPAFVAVLFVIRYQ